MEMKDTEAECLVNKLTNKTQSRIKKYIIIIITYYYNNLYKNSFLVAGHILYIKLSKHVAKLNKNSLINKGSYTV